MDKSQRMMAIVSLSNSYGVKSFSSETASLYVDGLADISDAELRYAMTKAIQELKWMPKVVELRGYALDFRHQNSDPKANERYRYWECNAYYFAHLDDPALEQSREYQWLQRKGALGVASVATEPELDVML